MQEQRWQDRPVTYGCLARLLILTVTILVIACLTVVLILSGGKSWYGIASSIFLGLSVLFGFLQLYQLFFSDRPQNGGTSLTQANLSPIRQAYASLLRDEHSRLQQGAGTIIVIATEARSGIRVYLLSRTTWYKLPSSKERDSSNERHGAPITRYTFNDQEIYVAIFRNLKPGEYIVWTGKGKDNPTKRDVKVDSDRIAEIILNWKD